MEMTPEQKEELVKLRQRKRLQELKTKFEKEEAAKAPKLRDVVDLPSHAIRNIEFFGPVIEKGVSKAAAPFLEGGEAEAQRRFKAQSEDITKRYPFVSKLSEFGANVLSPDPTGKLKKGKQAASIGYNALMTGADTAVKGGEAGDIASGAAVSGGTTAALPFLSKLFKEIPESLSWDAIASQVGRAADDTVPADRALAGRIALDEGVHPPIIGRSAQGISERVGEIADKKAQAISDFLADLSQKGQGGTPPLVIARDYLDILQKMGPRAEVDIPARNTLQREIAILKENAGYPRTMKLSEIEAAAKASGDPQAVYTLQEMQELKRKYGKAFNTADADPASKKDIQRRIYGNLKDRMESGVERDAGPEALQKYKQMKRESEVMIPAEDAAATRAARQSANVRFGLGAGQMGQIAAGMGGNATDVAAHMGLMELARRRGSSMAAGTLNAPRAVYKAVETGAEKYAPETVANIIKKGGKYAESLRQAAMSGPAALATTHTFLYDQDPFYRAEYIQAQEGL